MSSNHVKKCFHHWTTGTESFILIASKLQFIGWKNPFDSLPSPLGLGWSGVKVFVISFYVNSQLSLTFLGLLTETKQSGKSVHAQLYKQQENTCLVTSKPINMNTNLFLVNINGCNYTAFRYQRCEAYFGRGNILTRIYILFSHS